MKKAKEFVKDFINLTIELDKSDGVTSLMVIDDMERLFHKYANQEVKKHLEVAVTNAKMRLSGEYLYVYHINDGFVNDAIFIAPETILETEINLT